jgi:hypothetical protein
MVGLSSRCHYIRQCLCTVFNDKNKGALISALGWIQRLELAVERAQLPPDAVPAGSLPIKFRIYSIDMEDHDAEKSVFLVPN